MYVEVTMSETDDVCDNASGARTWTEVRAFASRDARSGATEQDTAGDSTE